MAKITRFTVKEFAKDAPSGEVGQFGSLAAGSPNYTKDPATMQALAAWLGGLADANLANNRPALEDINGILFLTFQALAYIMQAGIPEYDAGTTYYTGSFCQVAGVIYVSLDDDNIGNTPASSPTKWTPFIDTDDTLAADSDSVVPSQKAVKAYIDEKTGLGSLTDRSSDYPNGSSRAVETATVDIDVYVDIEGTLGTDTQECVRGFTDANANPTTSYWSASTGRVSTFQGYIKRNCFLMPVKAGEKWKVAIEYGSPTVKVATRPRGA